MQSVLITLTQQLAIGQLTTLQLELMIVFQIQFQRAKLLLKILLLRRHAPDPLIAIFQILIMSSYMYVL